MMKFTVCDRSDCLPNNGQQVNWSRLELQVYCPFIVLSIVWQYFCLANLGRRSIPAHHSICSPMETQFLPDLYIMQIWHFRKECFSRFVIQLLYGLAIPGHAIKSGMSGSFRIMALCPQCPCMDLSQWFCWKCNHHYVSLCTAHCRDHCFLCRSISWLYRVWQLCCSTYSASFGKLFLPVSTINAYMLTLHGDITWFCLSM